MDMVIQPQVQAQPQAQVQAQAQPPAQPQLAIPAAVSDAQTQPQEMAQSESAPLGSHENPLLGDDLAEMDEEMRAIVESQKNKPAVSSSGAQEDANAPKKKPVSEMTSEE